MEACAEAFPPLLVFAEADMVPVPAVVAVMLYENVHVAPAAKLLPVRLTEKLPGGAVNVPAQLVLALAGSATVALGALGM
jgi:hypothetical protein